MFQPKIKSKYLRFHSTLRTGGLLDYPINVHDNDPEICQKSSSYNNNGNNNNNNWGKIKCPVLPGNIYTIKMSRIFPVSTTWNMYRYSKIKIFNEYGNMVGCCDWYLDFNRSSNDHD